jgi:hypothetical protein
MAAIRALTLSWCRHLRLCRVALRSRPANTHASSNGITAGAPRNHSSAHRRTLIGARALWLSAIACSMRAAARRLSGLVCRRPRNSAAGISVDSLDLLRMHQARRGRLAAPYCGSFYPHDLCVTGFLQLLIARERGFPLRFYTVRVPCQGQPFVSNIRNECGVDEGSNTYGAMKVPGSVRGNPWRLSTRTLHASTHV